MRLNIQLFASLNVGDTYETTPVNIKPYGYNSNAYQMKFSVKLNSQNLSNFTSNITITSYMRTLNNSWGWSGFSKNYMERYTKVNDEAGYTLKNQTQLTSLPTNNANNWVNCGSWSGDIQHKTDGTCTLYVKNHLNTSGSSSYSYIPRDTEQESEALTLHARHKSPTINITGITELNTYLGVANNVFVQYLSKKKFEFTKETFDSATVQGITISNGSTSATGTATPITLDFTNKNLYTTANVIPIKAVISDSLGSTGTQDINYTTTPIMYNKPAINTSTSVKRNGQLSGKAYLNLNATFYNGTIGSTANTIEVNYRFWEKDTTEPNTWNVISNPTISGNNITVSNYEIGSTNTSASNYFNPQKAYNVKIYIKDAMRNASGTYMSDTTTKSIPLGESVWDEYKDRVDFKKITKQNEEVFTNEYSNSEKIVGKWIDDRPIYRKVYQFTLTSNAYSFETFNLGLSNIGIIYINSNSIILATNGQNYQLNSIRYQNNQIAFNDEYSWFRINGASVNYNVGNTLTEGTCYLIVEYTKTTN